MKLSLQREANLQSPVQSVQQRLRDYAGYQDWLPAVTSSRVLVREGDIAVVEFEAPAFSARRVNFECIHTAAQEWQFNRTGQVDGEHLSVRLRVSEQDGLAQLRLTLNLRGGWYGPLLRRRLGETLDKGLAALGRSLAHDEPGQTAGRRLLLEISQEGETPRIVYHGRRFKPADA